MQPSHAIEDQEAAAAIARRLKRAQGQIGGIITMLESGRSCEEIVTQMSAVSKAIDRAAFSLISTSLKECLVSEREDIDDVLARLQKLFLTMA